MIEVNHLTFRYPATISGRSVRALDDISLKVRPGEIIGITGDSGSGKSTFCRCLNGLIPHEQPGIMEGSVVVAGLDTREHPVWELAHHVGMVFQDPDHQLFSSDVDSEMAFGPEQLGWFPAEIESSIGESLAMLGIGHLRFRSMSELSWGERQLVAIASVMAVHPEVLVLDEPFSGLDETSSSALIMTLRKISREKGTAVIITEHRLGRLRELADRLFIFNKGAIEPGEKISEPSMRGIHTRSQGSDKTSSHPVISLRNVMFRFPGTRNFAIDIPGFDLFPGEITVLSGPNGSGKSTLIRLFNGLIRPDSGTVVVRGAETAGRTVAELSRVVGIVAQHADYQLFGETIGEELSFGPKNIGATDEEISDRVRSIADELGISPLGLSTPPLSLSAGEKQRVAIGSILVMNTPVMVLDEPTIGLDRRLKDVIAAMLYRLRDEGRCIVVATHDSEFAGTIADRIVRMDNGRITADIWQGTGEVSHVRDP